jgi:hypothetical protein
MMDGSIEERPVLEETLLENASPHLDLLPNLNLCEKSLLLHTKVCLEEALLTTLMEGCDVFKPPPISRPQNWSGYFIATRVLCASQGVDCPSPPRCLSFRRHRPLLRRRCGGASSGRLPPAMRIIVPSSTVRIGVRGRRNPWVRLARSLWQTQRKPGVRLARSLWQRQRKPGVRLARSLW